LRLFAEEKELGLGKVAQPLRVAICGNTISPPIFESVDIIGVDSTCDRIIKTIEKFSE
jgi:glutamyl-tRNA synthetase